MIDRSLKMKQCWSETTVIVKTRDAKQHNGPTDRPTGSWIPCSSLLRRRRRVLFQSTRRCCGKLNEDLYTFDYAGGIDNRRRDLRSKMKCLADSPTVITARHNYEDAAVSLQRKNDVCERDERVL